MRPWQVLVGAAALAALGAFALGARAFWWEPAGLRLAEYELALPRWPAACDGLRVAVLSDLHVGSPYHGLEQLSRISALARAAEPDLVLLPGDFVIQGVRGGRFVPPEQIAAGLRELPAPLGRWAVLGNHDRWLGAERMIRAFESEQTRVLEDAAAPLGAGECRFWLAGVSDFATAAHDVQRALQVVPEDAPLLVFTHNPDVFPQIPARVSLTVAGHTHGGQVKLPWLGRPIVPSRYGERYASGHVIEGGRHLFVSSGLGTSILPVRFGVPPEISLLTLRRQ